MCQIATFVFTTGVVSNMTLRPDLKPNTCVTNSQTISSTAQPIHWIYDVKKLDAMLEGHNDIAFWEPSANPFYTLPRGTLSGYGDQSLTIVQSLVQNNGMLLPKQCKSFVMFSIHVLFCLVVFI